MECDSYSQPLGAGDALLAGVLSRGPETPLAEAIATGIAAAAQAVRTGMGPASFTGQRVQEMFEAMRSWRRATP